MRIAIIGAGHNGLVCAAYLAQDGHKVTIFERNEQIGGLCISEPLFSGYTVSTVAGLHGMLCREVVDDLGLDGRISVKLADPAWTMLLPNGEAIVGKGDGQFDMGLPLTEEDSNGWNIFWEQIATAGRVIRPYMTRIGVTQYELQKELEQAGLLTLASRLFDGALLDILEEYFDNALLRAAVGSMPYELPTRKGTIFQMVYQATASACGVDGGYGVVSGGMGAITGALGEVAAQRGVDIRTGTPVKRVVLDGQAVSGVVLEDGESEEFDIVISNLDPRTTFGTLFEEKQVPMPIRTHLKTPLPPVSSAKIHLAISQVPQISALDAISHSYQGTIYIVPSMEMLHEAADACVDGKLPAQPVISLHFPSLLDESIAPAGRHLMTVEMHHVPVTNEGEPWSESNKQLIYEWAISSLARRIGGLDELIQASSVVSPGDLQERYGIVSGHCNHFPMTSEYLVEKRRLPYCGQHTTYFRRFYMCGAGSFPGGGVSGAPGYNCARTIRTIAKQKK